MAKLFIIENPKWDYDEDDGYLIRAESEVQARKIAFEKWKVDVEKHYKPKEMGFEIAMERAHMWLNPGKTTCKEVTVEGDDGILFTSFVAG